MKVRPDGFVPALRAQWLCAALDLLLGERDLSNAPALLSGLGCVLDHSYARVFAKAAFSLRQMGVDVGSEIQLRHAVHDAVAWEGERRGDPDYAEPPYEIDDDDCEKYGLCSEIAGKSVNELGFLVRFHGHLFLVSDGFPSIPKFSAARNLRFFNKLLPGEPGSQLSRGQHFWEKAAAASGFSLGDEAF